MSRKRETTDGIHSAKIICLALCAIGITADDDFAIAPRTGFGRGRAHCDLRKITRTVVS